MKLNIPMFFLVALVAIFSEKTFAFQVGDTVLAHCGSQLQRGNIKSIASDKNHFKIKFDDWGWDQVCDGYLENSYWSKDVLPYNQVPSYEVGFKYVNKSKFSVGEAVLAHCGHELHDATIVDLTALGFVKVKFDDWGWDQVCDGYSQINGYLKKK